MKRSVIFFILLLSVANAFAREREPLRETSPVHFSFSFRGGMWFPEDSTFRRIYGQYTNDIYFFELGWYPFRNFYLQGTTGFYYEPANPIGAITGGQSDEDVYLTLIPLEAGLGYRFNFMKDQLVVPYAGGGYDFYYWHEDPDPGHFEEGWENGWAANGGLLVLLDRFEPASAWKLYKNTRIDNSYLDLGVRYTAVGESGGVNFMGLTYYLGILFEF